MSRLLTPFALATAALLLFATPFSAFAEKPEDAERAKRIATQPAPPTPLEQVVIEAGASGIAGQTHTVSFPVALVPGPGDVFWLGVAPPKAPDNSQEGVWAQLDGGAMTYGVKLPKESDSVELRLVYATQEGVPTLVARQLVRVIQPAANALSIQAPRTAAPGKAITVSFSEPLAPPAGQQYWLTLTVATDPDAAWGQWQYVKADATSATITLPAATGEYEVRLHDLYPQHPFKVIARQPLTIQ